MHTYSFSIVTEHQSNDDRKKHTHRIFEREYISVVYILPTERAAIQ